MAPLIYSVFAGTMTSSENFWIQMCVRETRKAGIPGIRNNPLTDALELVSVTRSSTEVHSFVAETIATSSFSGSSWTQTCVREMAG